jgi:hypothetical protein
VKCGGATFADLVKGWQVFSRSAIHFVRGGFLGSQDRAPWKSRYEGRISAAQFRAFSSPGLLFGFDRSLDCFKINESRFEVIAGNFPSEHLEFPGVPAPAEMGKQFFDDVPGIEIVILQ